VTRDAGFQALHGSQRRRHAIICRTERESRNNWGTVRGYVMSLRTSKEPHENEFISAGDDLLQRQQLGRERQGEGGHSCINTAPRPSELKGWRSSRWPAPNCPSSTACEKRRQSGSVQCIAGIQPASLQADSSRRLTSRFVAGFAGVLPEFFDVIHWCTEEPSGCGERAFRCAGRAISVSRPAGRMF